jgi:hypothetical protein
MAKKDTDNILDDQDDVEDSEQPQTVRESIKAAFNEQRESDGQDSDGSHEQDLDGAKGKQRKARSDNDTDAGEEPKEKQASSKGADTEASRNQKREESEKKEEVKGDKVEPPPFYRNKGKATWDKLSLEDKQTITAREKEVSDGFAQVSQRIRAIEEIERVISPRLPMIQQLGISPTQTVERLFQWMDALQGPNKVEAFKDLAKSVGYNFAQAAVSANSPNEPTADGPPPWFSEFTGTVDQRLAKVEQIEQEIANQKQVHVANTVSNWAKDKPHYAKVAPLMGQLLQSGIVGLKADGSVDLDGAYEKAIKLDPDVVALIQQEATTKSAKEAEEKATREAKEKADKLTRARKAGSGLRPSPASGPSALPGKNSGSGLNGKKDQTVRGSIRAALEELRE